MPTVGAATDDAARPEMAERPDGRAVLDGRGLDDARPDLRAGTDGRVDELAPGTDDRALPDTRRAAQDDVRLESHVLPELDRPVEVDRGRVAHRHAVAHVGLVEAHPQAPFGGRQLRPVVDAVEPAVVVEGDRADQAAVLACERDEVRQVQLAGRRRGLERADPTAQPGRVEGVDARR